MNERRTESVSAVLPDNGAQSVVCAVIGPSVTLLKNRDLKVALLSVPAAYCQLFGYGTGFLSAWSKEIFAPKQPTKTEKL